MKEKTAMGREERSAPEETHHFILYTVSRYRQNSRPGS
jgi:hypothetical protein